MSNYTLESFISFCDDMMIAEESYRYKFKNFKDPQHVNKHLQAYDVSIKDIEEHCMGNHAEFSLSKITEKPLRSRFTGKFTDSNILRSEINQIKNSNIAKIANVILNTKDNSVKLEYKYSNVIGRLYESVNNTIVGGVTCDTIRVTIGIDRKGKYIYFKNAFPIPYVGFDEINDVLAYNIFPQ